MIKELRNELITFISSTGYVERCSTYRGELEEDGDWNPVFPASFVNYTVIRPASHSADSRMIGRNRYALDIYIADRNDCAETAELITNELDASEITLIDDRIYRVKILEVSLLGFIKAVEVWKLKIELI